ncbi:MAG: hypothetical protein AB7G39_06600 [Alphaproteobacteria bacterium]
MNDTVGTASQPPVLLTEEAPETRRQRRALLVTGPNPARRPGDALDYLIAYEACLDAAGAVLRLSYAPGKLILVPDALEGYIATLNPALPAEALAHVVLGDINDELVPRWVQIVIERPAKGPSGLRQRVLVEDREPHWDDPALLARAPRL